MGEVERREMYTRICSEYLKVRDRFGDLDVYGKIILKWILRN